MTYAQFMRNKLSHSNKDSHEYAEATGNPITLTDSLNRKFKSIKIFGESTQMGTPTPSSPIDIVDLADPIINVGTANYFSTEFLYAYQNGIYALTSKNGFTFDINNPNAVGLVRYRLKNIPKGAFTISYLFTAINSPDTNSPNSVIIWENNYIRYVFKLGTDQTNASQTHSLSKQYADSTIDIVWYGSIGGATYNNYHMEVKDIQVESGSVQTAFTPYNRYSKTLTDLTLKGIDTNCDYIEVKNKVVTLYSAISTFVLDSTDYFSIQGGGANSNGIMSYYTSIHQDTSPTSVNVKSISSHFPNLVKPFSTAQTEAHFIQRGAATTTLYIRILASIAPDVASFKNWLEAQKANNTPVTVYYPVATPTAAYDMTYTDLGQKLLELHSVTGDTIVNLNTTRGKIWVQYVKD